MSNPKKIIDLKDLRSRQGPFYLNIIEELIEVFTEQGIQNGKIKVTKCNKDVTNIRIVDSETGAQVDFIYRNQDLYIIGIVVNSVFYIDEDVYGELNGRIPDTWTNVVGTGNVETIPQLSYNNIMQNGRETRLEIGRLGRSLERLTQIHDRRQRMDIVMRDFAPFVFSFSEAIRFPVVAREVQRAIRVPDATVDLGTNLVRQLSLGHPDQRNENVHIFTIYSLLMNWGDLSDAMRLLYSGENAPPIRDKHSSYALYLDKVQLDALLGVARSLRIPVNRKLKASAETSPSGGSGTGPGAADYVAAGVADVAKVAVAVVAVVAVRGFLSLLSGGKGF